MGLRYVNDYFRYYVNPSRLAKPHKHPGTDIEMTEVAPCHLKTATCGYCETLSQQVAKPPPLPPKKPAAKKTKPPKEKTHD